MYRVASPEPEGDGYAMFGFSETGVWVPDVRRYFLLSFARLVFAVLIGRAANRRMRPEAFVRYVHFGLIGIGVMLLIQIT
jgi:hypothetical protein